MAEEIQKPVITKTAEGDYKVTYTVPKDKLPATPTIVNVLSQVHRLNVRCMGRQGTALNADAQIADLQASKADVMTLPE